MDKLIDEVLNKLYEYGISVYDQYPLDKNSVVLMSDAFTLFVNIKKKTLSVSFHAATKPEYVANHTLILNEIESIVQIDIMESFAYDADRQVISGDEAFKIVEKEVVNNIMQQQTFVNILLKEECYQC